MALRMIQVGTGGFGARWCMDFLPPNVEAGLIEVVAAVDVNPDALQTARESLGLSAAQCYTDIQQAPSTRTRPTSAPWSCRRFPTKKSWIKLCPTTYTSFRRSRLPTRWWRRYALRTR